MGELVHFNSKDINRNNAIELYNNSLKLLDDMQNRIKAETKGIEEFDIEEIEASESNLDMYDYLFSVIFGIIGATISSSDGVKKKIEKLHTDANKDDPDSIFGKLLRHHKDAIDNKVGGKYITRDGGNADLMFHRLLWGHDPLSFNNDNPFVLMMESNGKIRTVFKVFQHLIADTFSKQGLPLPGHSYFDFVNSEGKLSNYFAEISKELANNNRVKSQDIFSRMFTIRAQDIASQGFVWAACKAYLYARKIEDDTRKRQIKIISYSVNFFAHAGIGALRQGGVPYINWPALAAVIKELTGLYLSSYKEIKRLQKITESIIQKNAELEQRVMKTGRDLLTHNDPKNYIGEIVEQERKFDDLIDFFEEV